MTDQTAATECAFADEGCTCGRPRLTLTEAQARMAATPKPGPTFATYLDRHDRDQLDARTATAEAERDDALDDRDVLRQQLDTARAELGAAQELLAVVDDLAEQLDRARARYATRPEVTPVEPEPRHPGDALADALRNAYNTEQLATLHEELVHELDDDAPRENPLGRLVDALFAARWHQQPAGLGSAPPRAQEPPAPRPTAGELARLFHDTYEQLAPTYGYRTREESAKPWEQVPKENRALMIATCARVLVTLYGDTP